ncbi:hypothetical protein [Actinoplanes regularis]|uniref:hypothetical protein n=1 Tax=Actinoplanes regularis TaxID=52697 RepID=UPI0024A5E02E|nr:hypothetical protein [Actinoplanes regularis]GLW33827.1 hypothetical protein Areg01_67650 [Actinoplanes regularis]
MRTLGTRRAALVTGVATAAVIALAGCSAGQVAETALLDTPIAGVDAKSADGSVLVRDVQVEYHGIEGYAKGANAPLTLSLFNQTEKEVTVSITSVPAPARPLPATPVTPPVESDRPQVVSASQVGFLAAAPAATTSTPSAAASAPEAGPSSAVPTVAATTAAAPTVTAAEIKIKPFGSATFRSTDANQLQVIGLSDVMKPGTVVNLVLKFSNGAPDLNIQAPVAIPLSPASRAPGDAAEDSEHE